MKNKWLAGVLVLLVIVATQGVFAAETGTIRGKVLTKSGDALPGVTITIEGPKLQGKRTALTNEDGIFRFPVVPVGRYTLTYDLMGFAQLKQEDVPVALGGTTPIEATLAEARFEQAITVTAAAPLIERDTGDLSTRLSSETLDSMPSGDRTIRDIAKFVPGVTGVRINTVDGGTNNGMPSFRGEGQYGNNYLVDGLSVRDPAVKSTGAPLNYDAIEEIQIITDGFSPEYGRALGGTINVITKSGSNEFHGELALQYESDVLKGSEKEALWAQNRDFTKLLPYLNIGGPIIQDRLWFFGSYNYEDSTQKFDPVDYTLTDHNFFGKLTFAINQSNSINLSGNFRKYEDENRGIEDNRLPGALGMLSRDDTRIRLNYKSILTETTVLEAKYGFVDRTSDDDPASGSDVEPQVTDLDSGLISGNYDSFDHNERERNDFSIDVTHFLDEMMGSHELKLGILYEKTSSVRSLDFTGDGSDLFPGDDMEGGSEFQFRDGVPYGYFNYQGATVENKTDGWGLYLQDKWAPLDNLKIMAGFRMDSQDVQNDAGDTLFKFGLQETFAPRITTAFDVTSDGRNVIKFGAGRFYDVASTSLAEWGNTANPYSYNRYRYGGPGNPYTGGDYTPGDENNPDYWGKWRDYDEDGTYEFYPGQYHSRQDPTHSPLIYDDDLKPYYKDEILIGYDRGLGNNYAAKIRYIWAATRDLIEDVAYNETDWYIINFDKKRRDYQAVELEFAGRPMPGLQFNLAYVWTESEGTTPGQFERGGFSSDWGGGNDVGVFGDRLPYSVDPDLADIYQGLGGLDGDDDWYGPLPYATEHQITANATYKAPWDIVLGTNFEWNSGYYWQQRGWQDAYGGYLTFPEGRGAREMPSLFWWDLSVSKKFKFGENMSVNARIDIFNMLDSDKAVSLKQDWNFAEEDLNGDGDVDEDDDKLANPDFGEVLKRQDPRSARLTVGFSF